MLAALTPTACKVDGQNVYPSERDTEAHTNAPFGVAGNASSPATTAT